MQLLLSKMTYRNPEKSKMFINTINNFYYNIDDDYFRHNYHKLDYKRLETTQCVLNELRVAKH